SSRKSPPSTLSPPTGYIASLCGAVRISWKAPVSWLSVIPFLRASPTANPKASRAAFDSPCRCAPLNRAHSSQSPSVGPHRLLLEHRPHTPATADPTRRIAAEMSRSQIRRSKRLTTPAERDDVIHGRSPPGARASREIKRQVADRAVRRVTQNTLPCLAPLIGVTGVTHRPDTPRLRPFFFGGGNCPGRSERTRPGTLSPPGIRCIGSCRAASALLSDRSCVLGWGPAQSCLVSGGS